MTSPEPKPADAYRDGVATHRTLWEQGRTPARLVVALACTAVLMALALDGLIRHELGLLYDVVFVLACVGAALAVAPREFFVVGVLPPLMMAGVMILIAGMDRGLVTDPDDRFVQAVIAGLATHVTALAVGYLLALVVLGLRQIALRHNGSLRRS